MEWVFQQFKKNPIIYTLAISAFATIVIVNETLQFAERVEGHMMLLAFSLIILYILAKYCINKQIWRM